MVKTVTQLRDEWADRESIRDCLYRYARAVDRIDMDEARTTAKVESYHIFVIADPEGGNNDTIGSGRYLDRFEKRSDDWRIAKRTVLVDWWKDLPGTVDWKTGPFSMGYVPRGLPGKDDPSYGHFSG